MRGNRLLKIQHLKYVIEVIYPLTEVLHLYCVFLSIVHSSTEDILGKGS